MTRLTERRRELLATMMQDAIHEAVMSILKTGISYSRSGLQLTRASLPQLTSREKYLHTQLAKIKGNRSFVGDFS